jgi:hypothetical protein
MTAIERTAYSTLDRMARRIRTLVNGGIYKRILARLSETEQQALSALLQTNAQAPFPPSPGSRNPRRVRR